LLQIRYHDKLPHRGWTLNKTRQKLRLKRPGFDRRAPLLSAGKTPDLG
jgi:hypothetical protein